MFDMLNRSDFRIRFVRSEQCLIKANELNENADSLSDCRWRFEKSRNTKSCHREERRLFSNNGSDFCVHYGLYQTTPNTRVQKREPVPDTSSDINKIVVCERHQVMVLCNNSGSGHATKRANLISCPVLFECEKRLEHFSVKKKKKIHHTVSMQMIVSD